MRICLIADGSSIHTERWANYFAQAGHDVHLISNRFADSLDATIKKHRLITNCGLLGWNRFTKYPLHALWIPQAYRMIRQIKPDIVVARYITVYGYLGVVSGFHPLVLTASGSDILITPKRSFIHRILTRTTLSRADRIVCDSQFVKKEIMQLMQLRAVPHKIAIIYPGVDTQRFSPERRSNGRRDSLAIRSAPTIISIRNLEPLYNVATVIRAVPLVLAKVPEAQFIIAGDGSQGTSLRELANSLGVSGSVRFVGRRPHHEIPEFLLSSDVYVSPSLSDSASVSLQEAMACELPVVVSDIPGNREWVKNGVNGYLVPAEDVASMAQTMVALLTSPEQRAKLGREGRQKIVAEAEYVSNMQKAERLYLELVR